MSRAHSNSETSSEAAAFALHRSYARLSDGLRNSMGEAGRAALLERALRCTEGAHPALKDLRVLGADGVRLDDVAASIDTHGREDVASAIEALIDTVLEILTRLIGADLARQLIDDRNPRPHAPDGGREP